jgi:hypothetical protein
MEDANTGFQVKRNVQIGIVLHIASKPLMRYPKFHSLLMVISMFSSEEPNLKFVGPRSYFSFQQKTCTSLCILLDVIVCKRPHKDFLSKTSYSHSCLMSTLMHLLYYWEPMWQEGIKIRMLFQRMENWLSVGFC